MHHQGPIAQVKVHLHNSCVSVSDTARFVTYLLVKPRSRREARRQNALIRSDSLSAPLRPLLRPIHAGAVPSGLSVTLHTVGLGPATLPASPTSIPSEISARAPSVPSSSVINVAGAPTRAQSQSPGCTGLEQPTPSPHFPRDLSHLVRLGLEEAKALMIDYGIEVPSTQDVNTVGTDPRPRAAAGDPRTKYEGRDPAMDTSRQELLNAFLSFIGVSRHSFQ